MAFTSASPDSFLAIAPQSAQGTPNVAAAKLRWIPYISGNQIGPESEVVYIREGGGGLDPAFSYRSRFNARGQLTGFLRGDYGGQLLAALVGGATWNGGSLPATHVFHSNHASYNWNTILAGFPGTDLLHILTDVRFTSWEMEFAAGQPAKFTAGYVALGYGASVVAPAATFHHQGGASVTEEPFLFHHTPSIQIFGGADTTVDRVKITAGFSVEELQAQSISLDDAVVQNREFNVEVTRRYPNSTAYKNVWLGGGVAPTQSVATSAVRAIWAIPGAPTRTFDVHLPLVAWSADTLSELDPDGVTMKETFAGRALKGATHSLVIGLCNAHASAYAP